MFNGKRAKNQQATLSDMVRGILHSVNSSQVILEQHYDMLIRRYFNQEGKPLTTKFMIDSERSVEVPIITLINPSAMALKELDLEMSLHIDEVSVKKITNQNYEFEIDRGSLEVSIIPSTNSKIKRPSDMVDVCMKFRAIDPPEGISRVIDEFIKKIEPNEED